MLLVLVLQAPYPQKTYCSSSIIRTSLMRVSPTMQGRNFLLKDCIEAFLNCNERYPAWGFTVFHLIRSEGLRKTLGQVFLMNTDRTLRPCCGGCGAIMEQ